MSRPFCAFCIYWILAFNPGHLVVYLVLFVAKCSSAFVFSIFFNTFNVALLTYIVHISLENKINKSIISIICHVLISQLQGHKSKCIQAGWTPIGWIYINVLNVEGFIIVRVKSKICHNITNLIYIKTVIRFISHLASWNKFPSWLTSISKHVIVFEPEYFTPDFW